MKWWVCTAEDYFDQEIGESSYKATSVLCVQDSYDDAVSVAMMKTLVDPDLWLHVFSSEELLAQFKVEV